MEGESREDGCRMTMVCVDSCDSHGVLDGRLYHPSRDDGVRFHGLMEFFLYMEELMDGANVPQAYAELRTFGPRPESEAESPPDRGTQEGKLGTFAVRIIFRRNASWQGRVAWLEGSQESHFRSALELVGLMGSALIGAEMKRKRRSAVSSASCGA